ncbi:hypothetical protein [Streptomyces virginiae]|nr:hypothetical protein [Streptomyces virginiae]
MLLDAKGPSLLQKDDVVFKVEAVDAPATKASVGQQDGEWQGLFFPSAGEAGQGFDIPANGKMTWKVTLGLGANYPTNKGDFNFTATSYNNSVAPGGADSHLFKVDPQTKTGELKTWFKQVSSGKDGQEQRAYLDLNYQATGDGTFNVPLATSLTLSHPGEEKADFRLQALIDGRWQDLNAKDSRYELPRIAKGFGAASGVHTQPLRLSLGRDTKLTKRTVITMEAEVRQAEGNTWPLLTAPVQFPLAPIVEPDTTVPTTNPTTNPTNPTTSPSPTPTPSSTLRRPAGRRHHHGQLQRDDHGLLHGLPGHHRRRLVHRPVRGSRRGPGRARRGRRLARPSPPHQRLIAPPHTPKRPARSLGRGAFTLRADAVGRRPARGGGSGRGWWSRRPPARPGRA